MLPTVDGHVVAAPEVLAGVNGDGVGANRINIEGGLKGHEGVVKHVGADVDGVLGDVRELEDGGGHNALGVDGALCHNIIANDVAGEGVWVRARGPKVDLEG